MIKFLQILFSFVIVNLFVSVSFASNQQNYIQYKAKPSLFSNNSTIATLISVNDSAVCIGNANPVVTFKVLSGGTAPFTFYYTNNGVSGSISSFAGVDSAIIAVNTSLSGTYIITLDSVSYGGLPAEVQLNKQVSVLVGNYPNANFTYINNVCSGIDVNFIPALNDNNKYSYSWDFGDGSGTSTQNNPTHNFFAVGTSGTQTYSVNLIITDKLTGCVSSKTNLITITNGADTRITSDAGSSTYFNGFYTFSACVSESSKTITFNNSSSTLSTNLTYTIDWGDGTPIFTTNNWTTTTHNYGRGIWDLKYTVTTSSGCDVTRTYKVFLGSTPGVTLGFPGNTDICANDKVTFPITGTDNNPPGTTYEFFVNDGSAPVFFNHPPPANIEHIFAKTSCGTNSSDGTTTYPNAFSARIIARNPCTSSSGQVMPIYVTAPPPTIVRTSKTTACTNESITFNHLTTLLSIANSNGTCTTPNIVWSVTPNTNYTVTNGYLGNDFGSDSYTAWDKGTENISIAFTQPGTYVVKVRVGSKCSLDFALDTVCVTSPTTPTFILDKNEGCLPLVVNTDNTTSEVLNCGNPMEYRWEIASFSAGTCGTTASYTMTDGANVITNGGSNSKNTRITFNNPGTYTLRLLATNNCGPNSRLETIVVKAPPKVSINSIATLCQTFPETTIRPTAVIQNCGKDPLIYEWNFPGGNPSTSSSEIPGDITYATPGTYTITLRATNECGISTLATRNFTINPTPNLTSTATNQFKCAGQLSDFIDFTADLPATIFRWTNNNTQIGLPASGTGDILSFTLTNATNANITGKITVTPTLNGCDGASQTFDITVKPAVYFTSQPVSSTICLNGTAQTLSVTYANGTGIPQYQWYSNTTNSNSGGNLISGANASTFDPPTNTVGTVYYYCILTLPADVCGTITSNVATVAVSAIPTIDVQPLATQQLCVGGVINPLSVSTINGAGTPTYQWYSNSSNSNIGGTIISGANSINYTPPAFNTIGNYYYYVVVTYSASACGVVTSDVAEVVVVSDPIVTSQPLVSQTLCQNSASTPLNVVASGGLGIYNYQWYVNSSNSTVGGSIILGANTDTYTPPTSVVGTLYSIIV